MTPQIDDAVVATGSGDPNVSDAEAGPRGRNHSRRTSTIGVKTIKEEVARALVKENPKIEAIVLKHVESIDTDGDSRIDPAEMARFTVKCVKEGIDAEKKNRRLTQGILFAVLLLVLLALSTFGATAASVFLAKDLFVESGGGTNALVTENNEPVSVNENKVDIPIAALAYMPDRVCDAVSRVVLRGEEGEVYHRKVDSIDIVPEKSVVMATTKGDVMTWNSSAASNVSSDDSVAFVDVALSNGKTWSIPAGCGMCSATSVMADDDVAFAMESFRRSVSLPENGRRLIGCVDPFNEATLDVKQCRWVTPCIDICKQSDYRTNGAPNMGQDSAILECVKCCNSKDCDCLDDPSMLFVRPKTSDSWLSSFYIFVDNADTHNTDPFTGDREKFKADKLWFMDNVCDSIES